MFSGFCEPFCRLLIIHRAAESLVEGQPAEILSHYVQAIIPVFQTTFTEPIRRFHVLSFLLQYLLFSALYAASGL